MLTCVRGKRLCLIFSVTQNMAEGLACSQCSINIFCMEFSLFSITFYREEGNIKVNEVPKNGVFE